MCDCPECTKEKEYREFVRDLERRARERVYERKDPDPPKHEFLTIHANGKSYDIFCARCYTHERFFTGGGSWSPDLCPCGCEDTVVWNKMNPIQRMKAKKKYKEMKKKRGY